MDVLLAMFTRRVRFSRVVAVLLAAVAAGLLSDWLRADQRVLFPRPLPVFEADDSRR